MKKQVTTIFAIALTTLIGTSTVRAQDATTIKPASEVSFGEEQMYQFRTLPTSVSRALATLSQGTSENQVKINLSNPGKY
jgi:hypothetical protein